MENPVKGHPSEGKTQSRVISEGKNPVKGHPAKGKTQSRESECKTQSRDTQRKEKLSPGKANGKPSEGTPRKPSQGTPSEGKNPIKGHP